MDSGVISACKPGEARRYLAIMARNVRVSPVVVEVHVEIVVAQSDDRLHLLCQRDLVLRIDGGYRREAVVVCVRRTLPERHRQGRGRGRDGQIDGRYGWPERREERGRSKVVGLLPSELDSRRGRYG
jgi:hypothetical protein